MSPTISQIQRFFYSYFLAGGARQAMGIILPALVLGGVFEHIDTGFAASIGAACLAIVDSPGGPRRYGRNAMLAALLLSSLTTLVTGLVTDTGWGLWLLVPLLTFGFSMLNVYGKQGALLGFGCLLIMTLTMRSPMGTDNLLKYTLTAFLGGVFYLTYSSILRRLMWRIDTRQTLATALFATADYIAARASLYDTQFNLDASYRKLTQCQSAMMDAQQVARDVVLRELPKNENTRDNHLRQALVNIFVDMISLLDGMVATQTDYVRLRNSLPNSETLLFCRDALEKLAANVTQIGMQVARGQHRQARNSAKAELRAIEFGLQQWRKSGGTQQDPELYALLLQVLRRLRNMSRVIEHMSSAAQNPGLADIQDARINNSLNRFLSRQKWELGMLTSSLNMHSVHFRYALRVSSAVLVAMLLANAMALLSQHGKFVDALSTRGYWVILTVLIIMKPGFSITRQRNGWRLTGTLLGCALTMVLFALVSNQYILLGILILAAILGYGLIQVNYMLAATLITMLVMLAFHFLDPANTKLVIEERLTDTFIGSIIALAFSYILPSWEGNNLAGLARKLLEFNRSFLNQGIELVKLSRQARLQPELEEQEAEAQLGWRVEQQQLHYAYSNFAAAFYRMMNEPVRHQRNVLQFNHFLIDSNSLALQTAALIPQLRTIDTEPEGIKNALQATLSYLQDEDAQEPRVIETEGDYAAMAYPLRQMLKAAQRLRTNIKELDLN